ncbi:MAG: hypothetical protein R3279_07390, partial [Putridiphycobacter sp.]|nr:hypothetical protein [Putridiphycobacter sp.]
MNLKKHILLLILFCSSLAAKANVIVVVNGNDDFAGSLRQAITSAVSGVDTIIVNYKGAIALTSPIQIANKNNITIIGPYPKHIAFTAEGGG